MKMNTVKRIASLILALTLALCMMACEEKSRRRHSGGSLVTSSESTLPTDKSPLSGVACSEEIATARPVAVMVNNLKASLPQTGISEAEIIYEVITEDGITRFLCIYNDYKSISEIGSVRSARDYFIDLSDAHDAIFVHCGGSPAAYDIINKRKTENIDGYYLSDVFKRSPDRRAKGMAYEHQLVVSGESLAKAITDKGYRNTIEKVQPLSFLNKDVKWLGQKASHVEIPFIMPGKTHYNTSFFDYDATTALYNKGQFGAAHIDGDDNSTLAFKNVLVLECEHSNVPGDKSGRINVNFTGTGSGKYFTMGYAIDVIWEKDSRTSTYSIYKADNNAPLDLNIGNTYIALVPTGTTLTINE